MSDSGQWNDDDDPQHNERRLVDHLTAAETWQRAFFMLVFVVLGSFTRLVIGITVLVQFFWVLLSGQSNVRLADFGQRLATYSYEIILYLTYNTEERPFPFSDFPQGPPEQ